LKAASREFTSRGDKEDIGSSLHNKLHSYKYAAALQDAQAGDRKILLRVKRKAGLLTAN